MLTISMFYGIIVRIDSSKEDEIHAFYNDHRVIVNINTLEIVEGTFPKRQQQLLFAWMLLHQEELRANFLLARQGEKPFPITPLC